MPSMRKPKPRKVITTLRELVLDVDSRLGDGDEASDVCLSGADWAELLGKARAEESLHERGGRALMVGPAAAAACCEADDVWTNPAVVFGPDMVGLVFAQGEIRCSYLDARKVLERLTHGFGIVDREGLHSPDVEKPELEAEPEHAECPTCGEADGHKPADCAMRDEEPKPKKKRAPKRRMQITDVAPSQDEAPF